MAGYIGSKASVTQVDGYNQAEADAEFVNDPNGAITVDGSNNVGIGTSSPTSASGFASFVEVSGSSAAIALTDTVGATPSSWELGSTGGNLKVQADGTERMRIDSSGNLLVGKTSNSTITVGCMARADGFLASYREDDAAALFGRANTDGDIVVFRKGSTTVGSIGNSTTALVIDTDAGNGGGIGLRSTDVLPRRNGAYFDNGNDIGDATVRWDDIYATNGTIQTSDRNEKQDIEALSDAEQRVAVACKGLLRKFRWIDSVAEKGDNARIHFGIIAQDLQDAFSAEGLDAGRYAMFISSTWWETQTEVPAVEAVAEVLDDDGNVVTEAVEAKDAYTRTDTYETLEEAPEGATERTRLGVRYPELLAFIIGAM